MEQHKIPSTSNVISPQQERTELSGHRHCRRGVKSSLRREPDEHKDLLRARFGNVTVPSLALPPAAPFEPYDRQDRAHGDDEKPKFIAMTPIKFRHALEVHSPHAREERWWNSDHGDDGQNSKDIVLLDVRQPLRWRQAGTEFYWSDASRNH